MKILNNDELENIYGGGALFKIVMGLVTAGTLLVGIVNGYLNTYKAKRKWQTLNLKMYTAEVLHLLQHSSIPSLDTSKQLKVSEKLLVAQ